MITMSRQVSTLSPRRKPTHYRSSLKRFTSAGALVVTGLWIGAGAAYSQSKPGGETVAFPEHYEEGVHYTTVHRGGIREEIFVTTDAVKAAKDGQPLPSGTVITLVDYREGALFRYVVMEKRTGWAAEYPADLRNGDWRFQAFNADQTVNASENLERCFSCHKSQAANDFVFTLDDMKAAN